MMTRLYCNPVLKYNMLYHDSELNPEEHGVNSKSHMQNVITNDQSEQTGLLRAKR